MSATFIHTLKPISQAIGLRDYVASQVIQSIFHGQLKEGDRLIVQTMAASMQVSATPIREALVQLNEIGLVQQIPNKGAVCCAFGAKQLEEFFQIRRILEVESVRSVAQHPDLEALQAMSDSTQALLAQKLDGESLNTELAKLDEEFHEYLASTCGSNRLEHEIKRYGMLMHELRLYLGNRRNQQSKAMEEHLTILNALREGESEKAAAGMAIHINSAWEAFDTIMFSEGSAGVTVLDNAGISLKE